MIFEPLCIPTHHLKHLITIKTSTLKAVSTKRVSRLVCILKQPSPVKKAKLKKNTFATHQREILLIYPFFLKTG
jgi:hypothetical protein